MRSRGSATRLWRGGRGREGTEELVRSWCGASSPQPGRGGGRAAPLDAAPPGKRRRGQSGEGMGGVVVAWGAAELGPPGNLVAAAAPPAAWGWLGAAAVSRARAAGQEPAPAPRWGQPGCTAPRARGVLQCPLVPASGN